MMIILYFNNQIKMTKNNKEPFFLLKTTKTFTSSMSHAVHTWEHSTSIIGLKKFFLTMFPLNYGDVMKILYFNE